jgi:beta-lactamase regulating signal transducer with metallopeptidase domain
MNSLTESLLWCAVQVTLIGLLAWALSLAWRRWLTPENSVVPLAALAAVLALTACATVPWPAAWRFGPRWWGDQIHRAEDVLPAVATTIPAAQVAPGRTSPALPADLPAGRTADGTTSPALQTASDAPATGQPLPAAGPALPQIPSWLPTAAVAVLLAGAALGLVQLFGGLVWVRSYRRASQRVHDKALEELADVLRAELGCPRHVELRETGLLATAATVGWLRPVVLLPLAWREWTAEEQRAVLAHELAHVARGDYLACVVAQLSLALHFYHPLVHWLARRLRLEQELAADALAASLAGGPRAYLHTLAEMALAQSERPLGWPARTFLPTPGTFLRRIEMLRDLEPQAKTAPAGQRTLRRALAAAVLVAGAAAVAGLRGPADSPLGVQTAAAQPPDQPAGGRQTSAAAEKSGELDLRHVVNDARGVMIVRPQELLAQEQIRKAFEQAGQLDGAPAFKLLAAKNLRQATLVAPPGVEPDRWGDEAIAILSFASAVKVEEVPELAELKLVRSPAADSSQTAYVMADERTVIIGKGPALPRYLASRRKGQPVILAGPAWSKVQTGFLVAAIDMDTVRGQLAGTAPRPPEAQAVAPLWENSQTIIAGLITEGSKLHVRAIAQCENGDDAQSVAETTQAVVTLARNGVRSIRERERNAPAVATMALGVADKLLEGIKVAREESLVVAQTSTELPKESAAASSGLFAAVSKARSAAQQATSANLCKQIMIAMHMWADQHGGRFPPAVIFGKDGKGKVPHSWRVELLPYLNESKLYDAYQFDEPWDSDANKKVLAQIPAFFRHPTDSKTSTNASYFVLVGAKPAEEGEKLETAFSTKEGVKFLEIRDGTSNTIAVVEAKRDIPWTKPEDILFVPDKDPPKLGGYFADGYNVGLCDGSVRFLPQTFDPQILKLLITPQDGHPVPKF